MADLYGRKRSKEEIRKLVGDMSQIADMRLMSFEEGKARGMRSIECKNGSGLAFTILPDRGMDIAWASYQGHPFSYISKSEVCSPAYFTENKDKGFLDNFFAGVMTTSGLSNTGASNVDQGKEYGLHGVINNIPAQEVHITKEWENDAYIMTAAGKVRQSRFYGEDFTLLRTIKLEYEQLTEPVHGYQEQCFYHDFEPNDQGEVFVGLQNPSLGQSGLKVCLKYRKEELPYFCQWKQLGEQEYVMGLIPSTGYAEGRNAARKNHQLTELKPGEKKEVTLELGVKEL